MDRYKIVEKVREVLGDLIRKKSARKLAELCEYTYLPGDSEKDYPSRIRGFNFDLLGGYSISLSMRLFPNTELSYVVTDKEGRKVLADVVPQYTDRRAAPMEELFWQARNKVSQYLEAEREKRERAVQESERRKKERQLRKLGRALSS